MSLAVVAAVAAVLSAPAPLWLRLVLLAAVARGRIRSGVPACAGIRSARPDPLAPAGIERARRCAITFDDGPSPATAAVLDILATEGVPATFFVLGANVERHPAIVQRARDEGHAVGHPRDEPRQAGGRGGRRDRAAGLRA